MNIDVMKKTVTEELTLYVHGIDRANDFILTNEEHPAYNNETGNIMMDEEAFKYWKYCIALEQANVCMEQALYDVFVHESADEMIRAINLVAGDNDLLREEEIRFSLLKDKIIGLHKSNRTELLDDLSCIKKVLECQQEYREG